MELVNDAERRPAGPDPMERTVVAELCAELMTQTAAPSDASKISWEPEEGVDDILD